jgi:hypothetical protein
MWVDIRIPDKIAHLREFGFGDPVKRSRQILRLWATRTSGSFCGGIVTRLDKGPTKCVCG